MLTADFLDVTGIFKNSKSKVIRKAVDKNHKVLAVKLSGFNG
jgi:Glu-tRNA(Gln) amidotransferase subunit E-like FAD-binding protein